MPSSPAEIRPGAKAAYCKSIAARSCEQAGNLLFSVGCIVRVPLSNPGAQMKKLSIALCSLFLLVAFHATGQGMRLSYTAHEGMDYQLESTVNLKDWLPVGELITGTGQEVTTSVGTTQEKALFRVKIHSQYHLIDPIAPSASLVDLVAQCNADTWRATSLEILSRRYPEAKEMMHDLPDPTSFDFWFGGGTSFNEVIMNVSSAVHESVHELGFRKFSYGPDGWIFPVCLGNDLYYGTPDRSTFPRSEVLNLLPEELKNSGYASTYLTGQSGSQGFISTLDEVNAYTISSLVDTAIVDQFPPGMSTSSRDGLLTLMLYAQLYLKAARIDHPVEYGKILGDRNLVRLIVVLMDRANYALSLSGADPRLGIQDALIRTYVDQNRGEIAALRNIVGPKLTMSRLP